MKNKLFIALFFICFCFISCEEPLSEEVNLEKTTQPVPPLTKMPAVRSIYVNNFSTILGNTALEDALLNWCQTHLYNRLNLYNISTIIGSTATANQLNAFIFKAKSAPYYMKVSFIASSASAVNNFYNNYYLIYPNKPDAITTEYEFWNSPNNFTSFMGIGNNMTTVYNSTTSPQVQREIYVSQFVDNGGAYLPNQIAEYIVNNHDRVYLVNYVTNAYNYGTTLQNKLQLLANAGATLNKTVRVVILFNVNTASSDPNIYNYFSTSGMNNPFYAAYNNVLTGYNAASFPNKSFLLLQGYSIYRHSNAVLARP